MKEFLFNLPEQAGVSADGVRRISTVATQMIRDGITPLLHHEAIHGNCNYDARCPIADTVMNYQGRSYAEIVVLTYDEFGAYSTSIDLAIFGQMFLNGGIYNKVRLLSPITVKEMTRNQISGVSSQYRDEVFPEAYWDQVGQSAPIASS